MKKLFSIMLLGLMLLGLCSCGKTNGALGLVPPDDYFCNHFQTFFEGDTFVQVEPYTADDVLRVHISDMDKYCALFKCFNGGNWKFGGKKFKIDFIYEGGPQPNVELGAMYDNDINALFKGNKYFIKTQKQQGGFEFFFVVLKQNCIQTYTDNIGSINGCDCKSAEDVCRDIIFRGTKLGVQFCSIKE